MKVVVAGKGGAGKTTVSGTLSRALARAGHRVTALDADTNPMLGISLGVGPEQTELLVGVRQGLDTGETEHEPSTEGFVDRFGRDAPDGVRLVVATRIERLDPGCPCCGVSPEGLLRELEADDGIVVGDLEAGTGTVTRLREGDADVVIVVAQPTAKSIEVSRRALQIAAGKVPRVIVVANRVRNEEELAVIRAALGDHELVVVPDERAIAEADREGRAPLDVDAGAPGVRALVALADRLVAAPTTASHPTLRRD
jgi:CO dehydrogenase maturation factor